MRVRAVALVVVCGMASGCLHSATAPPPPVIHPGVQAAPAAVQALLHQLPAASRPTGTAAVSASMRIAEHRYAGRSLVLVAYPASDGACVEETYITTRGSQAFGGDGVRGGRCQVSPCRICIPPADTVLPSNAFVSLITDRADAVRVTFATLSEPIGTLHHDYALSGPDLPQLHARVFMLDPTADIVLRIDALRKGRIIASAGIAGFDD